MPRFPTEFRWRCSLQDASADSLLADFLDGLSAAPSAVLILDYDGTLAPFQVERNRAFPYPEVLPVLEGIVRQGRTRVIIVTGRPVADMDTLLSPLNHLEIWGSHGIEHRLPDGSCRQTSLDRKNTEALAQAREWVTAAGFASRIETKPGGIALHWRGLSRAEMENMEARTREGWDALANPPQLRLLAFDGGLELRVTHPDKGDAVAAILKDSNPGAQFAYLGDDLTDEDAFRVLDGRGLSILVRGEYRSTLAKVWLKPPQELVDFLERWRKSVSA
jgi:trehalose 6-phosphate phosphatase